LPALKYVKQHLKMPVVQSANMPSLEYVGGNFEAPKLIGKSHLESLKKVRMSFLVGSIKSISFAQDSVIEIGSLGSMSCYEVFSADKDKIREFLIDLEKSGIAHIHEDILKTLKKRFIFTNPHGGLKTDFKLGDADLSAIEIHEKHVKFFREGVTTSQIKIQNKDGSAMTVIASNNGVLEGAGYLIDSIDSRSLHIFVVDENQNIFKGKIEEIVDEETHEKCYIVEKDTVQNCEDEVRNEILYLFLGV
jgi:hypothetical protein